MARNQAVISTVQNIFALNRVKKQCYYEPIRVDFSPISKSSNAVQSIVPFYNNDQNYFTPAFVLQRQKNSLKENLQTEINKFEVRIFHALSEGEEITPQYKPTESKYCQLCHDNFKDYWEHINDKYHKRMINSSKFNKEIVSLCKIFEAQKSTKKGAKQKKIEKKKQHKKTISNQDIKSEDKGTKQCNKQEDKIRPVKKSEPELKDIENINQRIIEESLKVMQQLGNYSTNLVSNNTFKILFHKT